MSYIRQSHEHSTLKNKLNDMKIDTNSNIVENHFKHASKYLNSAHKKQSRQKTMRMSHYFSKKEDYSHQKSKNRKLQNDYSKESKQSRQSLIKSTNIYYLDKMKKVRSSSSNSRAKKYYNSISSNVFNHTFDINSPATHKKKKSTFSSTMVSKYEAYKFPSTNVKTHLNGCEDQTINLSKMLLKATNILDMYKQKCQNLEKENKKYKKKYTNVLKKVKRMQAKK